MGLFARRSNGGGDQVVSVSEIPDGVSEPAVVESKPSRMMLRKRPIAQEAASDGLVPEQDSGSQSKAKKPGLGMFARKSKPSQDEYTMEPAPLPSTGIYGEKKTWLGRKSKEDLPIAPPPQPGDIVRKPKKQKVPKKPKKKTKKKKAPKRNWVGRKLKDQGEPEEEEEEEEEEDDTSVHAPEVVQEPVKPPPRIRTPEEIAAGLERQKAAVNAIRNTPEKRAATRAAAPIEIPSTTNATGYSTAPVDRSGANRTPNDRSGGRFKGMFKVKGMPSMPSMPSVPGMKKRNSAPAGESTVVSSAPVEVDPSIDPTVPADNADGKVAPAVAADMKSRGKFMGMFMRGSGKAKKPVVVKNTGKGKGRAKGKGKGSSVQDEVELSDHMDQLELSDEPVLDGEPTAEYSQPTQHVPFQQPQQPAQYVPSSYSQQHAGTSGITTQEYAPVLPHTNGHQLEPSSGAPLHHHVTDSGSGYPEGGSSYRKGGMQQSNGYGHHAGGYGGEQQGGDQMDSGEWDHINRTWNQQ